MTSPLDDLLGVLDLERIDRDLFRGRNEANRGGRLFGGQVAAQSLAAAQRTVEDRRVHSLHGYFLRPGNPEFPVVFSVDRIRDGRSFTTRRVVGLQNGEAIFSSSISFHADEPGLEHQDEMPDAPDPETLPTRAERAKAMEGKVPPDRMAWITRERPIESRPVESDASDAGGPSTGHNHVWVRAGGPVPDDPTLHAELLTYASDMGLVSNIHRPHRKPGEDGSPERRGVMMASLDHTIWFHRPIRIDDWLLFDQYSPTAAGARGFVTGAFYDRSGTRIASVAQEGLMRPITR